MAILFSGTGSYIPPQIVDETHFLDSAFYNEKGDWIKDDSELIIKKFKSITGIRQRRYASKDQVSSDLGTIAAQKALEDAGVDPESLNGIIFTHNYGNIPLGTIQSDTVPALAARVKHNLKIKNPNCVVFDVMGGCPGWIQSVIIAKQFIQGNPDHKYLVIGSETLSRVTDPHDRDSMIYSDGAGAVIMSSDDSDSGILSYGSKSFTFEEVNYLDFNRSYNKEFPDETKFIKMKGRRIYEFALTNVPLAMKECLEKANIKIEDVSKVLLHQANEKMDEAILKRFYELYGVPIPEDVMPMSIELLGNSSVATVPTLLDLILNNELPPHTLKKGEIILMASVGAGMNVNAMAYRI